MTAAAATAAAVLLLAGCGADAGQATGGLGQGAAASAAGSAPAEAEPSVGFDTFEEMVRLSSAFTDGSLEQAAALASPGSPAERYFQHRRNLVLVAQVNGGRFEGAAPVVTAGPDAGTVTLEYDDGDSVTLSDPVLDEDGVVSWTSPSGALQDLLWSEPAQATVASTTFTLDSAYRTNVGDMYVLVSVTAPAGLDYLPTPVYVGPDGIARAAASWDTPSAIPAGSTGKAVFVYPDAGFGGTLTFDGVWIGDDPHRVTLAVR